MRVPLVVRKALLTPSQVTITALVAVIYAAVFISSVVVFETVPSPPKPAHQHHLNLDQAWSDLQAITQVPHPYNSHANEAVRSYLLDRLRAISRQHPSMELADDQISNGTYFDRGQVVYFEGNNLLVKIDGYDTSLPAVLFSAHFDSVSTGFGATDDGMGVVTLLQLVEYYAKHRPKKTVVFNINNGEEDWLNGAHAFLDHPWSKLPTTFLNLEGAGNGGRPVLFRTSSFDVTSAFRSVSRPYGSTLSSDAFKRGLIRSGTDFTVYEDAGMRGLDLAFYRRRSRYHTVYDSAAWLGNQGSLWLMMENALEAGNALVSDALTSKAADAVYFDIFGSSMVVISRQGMLALNIILLVLGPVAIVALVFTSPDGYQACLEELTEDSKVWIHAPILLLMSNAATFSLAAIYSAANTYIVYSSPYVIAASLISIAILAIVVPAKLLAYYLGSANPALLTTANHAIFTLFWWFLLCWTTGQLNVNSLGGFYYVTFAYVCQLGALILSFGAMLHLSPAHHSEPLVVNGNNEDTASSYHDEPTETTSLLSPRQIRSLAPDVDMSRCTWSAEILASLVFPSILASGILILLLNALPQTLADGNSAMTVYLAIGLISIFIALPVAPVAFQIHRSATFFLALVLVGTMIYNLAAFPFSPLNPLKIYFQQSIDLDSGFNQVQLVTVPSLTNIANNLPSARLSTVKCADDVNRLGLVNCAWTGPAPNVTLNSRSPADWMWTAVKRTGPNDAEIEIRGRNTRSCRIYSDTPMSLVSVQGGHWETVPSPDAKNEFKEIRLWSRTWDKKFKVRVQWANDEPGSLANTSRTGRLACEWAEWDSGKIPALDEMRAFLPPWAVVSKLADGLVEGTRSFEV